MAQASPASPHLTWYTMQRPLPSQRAPTCHCAPTSTNNLLYCPQLLRLGIIRYSRHLSPHLTADWTLILWHHSHSRHAPNQSLNQHDLDPSASNQKPPTAVAPIIKQTDPLVSFGTEPSLSGPTAQQQSPCLSPHLARHPPKQSHAVNTGIQ